MKKGRDAMLDKAKPGEVLVTISKNYSTYHPQPKIHIAIEDRISGIHIVEVEMDLEGFADVLTGLGRYCAKAPHVMNEHQAKNIGRRRETKSIYIKKPVGVRKKEQKANILAQVKKSGELKDGWTIFSDGTNSRQDEGAHRVVLYRYVDA